MRNPLFLALCALFALAPSAQAQLPPPQAPPQNPVTESKRVLGKLLFWEEQLSSDDTMACGTCHRPGNGGSDPRLARNPGPDGTFFNADDKLASPGVVFADASDDYQPQTDFGFDPQVTGRYAPNFIMAAYAPELFWDGRARGRFVDPETGAVSIPVGGALESQAVGPPVNEAEMAHAARDWGQINEKLGRVRPMALASDLPPDMDAALNGDPDYPQLFADAFGDTTINAERIAFAIATYERTLIADDTPWDRFVAGDAGAMTPQQQQGWQVFQNPGSRCSQCHVPPLFTNHSFRNIGIRPVAEDRGRQDVTGNAGDRGRFKVPTLRNVGLKSRFFHNGGVLNRPVDDLRDVVDYYIPAGGHVQFADNIDPLVPGINMPPGARADLAEFLTNGLTDPRVAAETFPFDRPRLASEHLADHMRVLPGTGVAGTGGIVPAVIALSPPTLGSRDFRLGVHDALSGARAFIVLSRPSSGHGRGIIHPIQIHPVTLEAGGHGTWHWNIPDDPGLAGAVVRVQWFVFDPGSSERFARSAAVELTLF
jgi:cytochrome c peroxidase